MSKQEQIKAMNEQLRDAMRDCGSSLNQLATACHLDSGQLSRFMRGERDLTTATASRLCNHLGLKLSPTGDAASSAVANVLPMLQDLRNELNKPAAQMSVSFAQERADMIERMLLRLLLCGTCHL